MATSSSSSSGSSSSTSSPVVVNTPHSDWALNFAKSLEALGNQQYQWALGQYQTLSDLTDQQIGNFLRMSDMGESLGGNAIDRYINKFAPAEDQYLRDAGEYASPERLLHEMGRAQARQTQAGQRAKANAEQELQSFGVDPSSGRYQDLLLANNTQTAAAAAAAGEEARARTEAEGDRRRMNAAAIGAQLPGTAVNAVNSAYQGVAGAQNAALGRANAGVQLVNSADPKFGTAMSLKYPPVGQNTQGHSQQSGQSQSSSPGAAGGAGAGRGAGAGGAGNMGGGGSTPYAGRGSYSPYGGVVGDPNMGGGRGVPGGMRSNIQQLGGGSGYAAYDPNSYTDAAAGVYDAYNYDSNWDPNAGFGGTTEDMWGDSPYWTGGYGNTQGADFGGAYGSGGDYSYDTSQWETGGDSNAYGGWDSSAFQSTPEANWDTGSNYYADTGGGWDSYDSSGDYGDYYDYGGSSGFDTWYAGGGQVPASMSPSGGQQVDDVPAMMPNGGPARLNANEFVIPQDVALWKGQEFFQNLIKKSREARTGAPAKPTQGRANGAPNANA